MTQRGFTLAEMLTSLLLTGAVMALATHAIVAQLRFLNGVASVAGVRTELQDVNGIVQGLLWAVSPADITVARDSALEFRAPIGTAVVCEGMPGAITIPLPAAPGGNALAAFGLQPDVGDNAVVLLNDSLGVWTSFDLTTAPTVVQGCQRFGETSALRIATPALDLSSAQALHVLRPFRLSIYRAADGQWYLGGRDWNGQAARFNSIQPIAGPLRPYSRNPALSGLAFVYADSAGAPLADPADPSRVATITMVARAETRSPVRAPGMAVTPAGTVRDSLVLTVRLRNAR